MHLCWQIQANTQLPKLSFAIIQKPDRRTQARKNEIAGIICDNKMAITLYYWTFSDFDLHPNEKTFETRRSISSSFFSYTTKATKAMGSPAMMRRKCTNYRCEIVFQNLRLFPNIIKDIFNGKNWNIKNSEGDIPPLLRFRSYMKSK